MSSLPPNEVPSSVRQTNILKHNLSEVSEAPKKTMLEKKILVAMPKEKVPPAKGIWGFTSFSRMPVFFYNINKKISVPIVRLTVLPVVF